MPRPPCRSPTHCRRGAIVSGRLGDQALRGIRKTSHLERQRGGWMRDRRGLSRDQPVDGVIGRGCGVRKCRRRREQRVCVRSVETGGLALGRKQRVDIVRRYLRPARKACDRPRPCRQRRGSPGWRDRSRSKACSLRRRRFGRRQRFYGVQCGRYRAQSKQHEKTPTGRSSRPPASHAAIRVPWWKIQRNEGFPCLERLAPTGNWCRDRQKFPQPVACIARWPCAC